MRCSFQALSGLSFRCESKESQRKRRCFPLVSMTIGFSVPNKYLNGNRQLNDMFLLRKKINNLKSYMVQYDNKYLCGHCASVRTLRHEGTLKTLFAFARTMPNKYQFDITTLKPEN